MVYLYFTLVALILGSCSSEVEIPTQETPTPSATQEPDSTPDAQRPFGFSSGQLFADSGPLVPSEQQPGEYVSTTPPKPDERFKGYLLVFSPTDQLCMVTGLRAVRTGSEGAAVRAAFAELSDEVTSAFGSESQRVDSLQEGSEWSGSADWMIALRNKERMLASIWGGDEDLEGDVTGVALQTDAVSINSALLRLSFYFKHTCS